MASATAAWASVCAIQAPAPKHHKPPRMNRALASWYNAAGGPIACGGDSYADGVANRTLPCGTRLVVCYARCVQAVVFDRGPYVYPRSFDLSAAVRDATGFPDGVATIRYRLEPERTAVMAIDWQAISYHRREPDLDLGDDHVLWYFGWFPDRDLNPQYAGLPDVERAGASVGHLRPDGTYCEGGVTFDLPPLNQLEPPRALWQVQSFEPLTISPSLLCKAPVFGPDHELIPGRECGDHGFIREGKWVRA